MKCDVDKDTNLNIEKGHWVNSIRWSKIREDKIFLRVISVKVRALPIQSIIT